MRKFKQNFNLGIRHHQKVSLQLKLLKILQVGSLFLLSAPAAVETQSENIQQWIYQVCNVEKKPYGTIATEAMYPLKHTRRQCCGRQCMCMYYTIRQKMVEVAHCRFVCG